MRRTIYDKLFASADKVRAESEKKRIMILMSDTGGGHRASAEALKAGFEKLYGDKYKVSNFAKNDLDFSITHCILLAVQAGSS